MQATRATLLERFYARERDHDPQVPVISGVQEHAARVTPVRALPLQPLDEAAVE